MAYLAAQRRGTVKSVHDIVIVGEHQIHLAIPHGVRAIGECVGPKLNWISGTPTPTPHQFFPKMKLY